MSQGAPVGLGAKHGIEDREELAHAGDQGDLLRFALGQKPVVEGAHDGIPAGCHEGTHVERCPHRGPTAPTRGSLHKMSSMR